MTPEKHTASAKQSLYTVLEEKRAGKRARESMPLSVIQGKKLGGQNRGAISLLALTAYMAGQALGKKDWRVKGLFSFSAPIT